MAVEMARAGHHADRTKSKNVLACKDILDECPADDARVIQMLAANRVAALEGFADDGAMTLARRRAELSLVLNEASVRHRRAEGRDIRTLSDYRSVSLPNDPSYNAFRCAFGSWLKALLYAGLVSVPYAEAHLVIREGRPPKSQSRSRTLTEHIKSVAQCIEHLGGFRPSTDQYKTWHLACGPSFSTYNQITGVKEKGKKRSWEQMVELAVRWILDHPELYPRAFPVLQRVQQAAHGNGGAF